MLASKSFSEFLSLGDKLVFGEAAVFLDDALYSCLSWDLNFKARGFLHLLPKPFGYRTLAYGSTFVFYVNGLVVMKL